MRAVWLGIFLMTAASAGWSARADRLKDCLDKPKSMTTLGMKECNYQEIDRLNIALKIAFRSALARELQAPEKLKAAQQAWERFTNAECDYAYSRGANGTISGIYSSGCMIEQKNSWLGVISAKGMTGISNHDGASKAYRDCLDKVGTGPGMHGCLVAELVRVDAALNKGYRKRLLDAGKTDHDLGELAAGERPSLQSAERAWIGYRDALCGYLAARKSADAETDMRCRLALTGQRIRDLSRE